MTESRHSNEIQFARLLCELVALGEPSQKNWSTLEAEMDLTKEQISEILERAHLVWGAAKRGA